MAEVYKCKSCWREVDEMIVFLEFLRIFIFRSPVNFFFMKDIENRADKISVIVNKWFRCKRQTVYQKDFLALNCSV